MKLDVQGGVLRVLRPFLDKEQAAGAALPDHALMTVPFADLNLDSLDKLEFVMKLEDEFGIMLDEGAIAECATLADLAALVRQSVQEAKRCAS
jgi:acyl carrier protein